MAVGVKDEECRVKGGECSQGISPAKDRRAYYYTYDDHRTFSYFLVLSRLFIPKKKVAPKTIIYPGTGTGVRSCCMLQRVAPLQKCTCNTDVFIACLFRMNKNKK
jgi:hypothetical protein